MLYVVLALFGAVVPNGETGGRQGPIEVHLLSGPIHYDFLLPIDETSKAAFAFAEVDRFAAAEWIIVGWGSRGFYTSTKSYADLSGSVIWQAAIGDNSVLRVDVAGHLPPDLPYETLHLTADEYALLMGSIVGDLAGDRAIAGASLSGNDQFFEAKGRFHLLRTCNVWVAEKMRDAGLAFGRWTPLPVSVTWSARWFQSAP